MFRFESLEFLNWDYWRRVRLPFDERIIAIVGPNGSGKTTLLDALRTLLGIKVSSKRDYRRYAQRLKEPHSMVVAVVRNDRDARNRPCFYPHFSDKVTLACRIDKKGGEWHRLYFIKDGVVSVEEIVTYPASDALGLREYQATIEKAGLSLAMMRVLSLEQGATDKLCEYSPRELLGLVYDVFGDKTTLDNYEKALQDQLEAEREQEQLRLKAVRLEGELMNLVLKEKSYREFERLGGERTYLETELKTLARHAEMAAEIEGAGRNVTGAKNEVKTLAARVEEHAAHVVIFEADEARMKLERDSSSEAIDAAQRRLVEENRRRGGFDAKLEEISKLAMQASGVEPEDVIAMKVGHEAALKSKGALDLRFETIEDETKGLEEEIKALDSGVSRPDTRVTEFSHALDSAGISHRFLYEGVEVTEEKWRLAIESILRGYRYLVVLDDPARRRRAWELAESSGYRHFVVPEPGDTKVAVPPGTALAVVGLKEFVPGWVRAQLAGIFLVDEVKDGLSLPEGTAFVTARGFMRERRGGRSIAVAESEFAFGAEARKKRLEFLRGSVAGLKSQADSLRTERGRLDILILEFDTRRKRQETLSLYLSRKDEEDRLSRELSKVMEAVEAIDSKHKSLQARHKTLDEEYAALIKGLATANNKLGNARDELARSTAQCSSQRQALYKRVTEFRAERAKIPAGWRTSEKVADYKERYGDVKGVQREIDRVLARLQEGQWEKDPKVVEFRAKVEKDFVYEKDNVGRKEREFAETRRVTDEAREAYIGVMRTSVRFYERNLKELAGLAGVEVDVVKPPFENDAVALKEAGLGVRWNFDGKGFISTDDGEASGGQQVIKSLILLIALMMDERSKGGFVFIDEPFAHLDVFNIDKVAEFLLATKTQFIITSPNTHNANIYRPAMLTILTKKKQPGETHAPAPGHIRRHSDA
jgi:chromosome segregation ATPase